MMALFRLWTCIHNNRPSCLQAIRNHDVLTAPFGLRVKIAVHWLIEGNNMHVVVNVLAARASYQCFHVIPCCCAEEG